MGASKSNLKSRARYPTWQSPSTDLINRFESDDKKEMGWAALYSSCFSPLFLGPKASPILCAVHSLDHRYRPTPT